MLDSVIELHLLIETFKWKVSEEEGKKQTWRDKFVRDESS